jgi:hypothetical protein
VAGVPNPCPNGRERGRIVRRCRRREPASHPHSQIRRNGGPIVAETMIDPDERV